MFLRRLIIGLLVLGFVGLAAIGGLFFYFSRDLPEMITLADYKPLMVSEVYDREGKKIGEFFREKRTLVKFEEMPEVIVEAFLAAEDASFYEHGGINYLAILRAMLANLQAGGKVQGASTITQQVARSLLLTRAKTYERKIKEVLLSYQMEKNLSKQDILYLYLNQIYLGQGAYGVAVASEVYFNKPLKEITLPEAAILAGLPKAPTAYSPLRNPSRAKERQRYVIGRMQSEGMITADEAKEAAEMPVKVFERSTYWDKAPHFLETVRQMLIADLGEEVVLDQGIKVYTSLDLEKQQTAQEQIQLGLRELDKRQGYRGPLAHLEDNQEIAMLLLEERNRLIDQKNSYRILQPDGTLPDWGPLNLTGFEKPPEDAPADYKTKKLPTLPEYIPLNSYVKGIVTKLDDEWGLVHVRFAESKGLIDLETLQWVREPDPNVDVRWIPENKKVSKLLKVGDVVQLKVMDNKFRTERLDKLIAEKKSRDKKFKLPDSFPALEDYARVELEQTPLTQGALLAIDQKTNEVISMIGGYEFSTNNQLNRSIQAVRQTGSAFKPFVYLAALDKGYSPASMILDAPIVYEEEQEVMGSDQAETLTKKWKPSNHSNKFFGDILFRNALIHSLNVPSVKIIENIGVNWAADYARRLGVFSPLNMDYTLALGSSSVTLYEMVKAFSQIGKGGRRVTPIFIHKVEDQAGNEILKQTTLDKRFAQEIETLEEYYRRRRANALAWQKSLSTGIEFKPAYPIGQGGVAADSDLAKQNESAEKAAVNQPAAIPEANASSEGGYRGPALPHPSKEPPFFFADANQLLKPQSAYVLTSLMQGVVEEPGGTGARARSLNRPVAGKTGTTSNYYDAWFLGYTTDIAAGVWVGFDEEKPLGRGEVGGRSALPIWVEYMTAAHKDLPSRDFSVPENIVFASIDNSTGRLASANSEEIVRQAFEEGTEPKEIQDDPSTQSDDAAKDFFKEDLAE